MSARLLPLAVALLGASAAVSAQDGASCRAASGAAPATLVELYTSEGCSSCPPADRWLSRVRGGEGVVAVAFHVHYWDHLGWRDRFASRVHTQRQAEQRAVNGARVSYTPQVVLGGRDAPDWYRLGALPAPAGTAPVAITLARDGAGYGARVAALAGAPPQLSGWWAVTEDGHESAVKAGENDGATLRHDAVVREYRPIAAWTAAADRPVRLAFTPATAGDPRHPRRLVLVVTDAASGRPLQALQLGC